MRNAFVPVVTASAIATLAAACSDANPHASPEAALRAFVAAGNDKDVEGMRAVAVSPDRLKRALACPPDDHKIDVIEAIENARETMAERAGMAVRLISVSDV